MHKVLIPSDIAEAGKKYLIEHGCELIMGSGEDEAAISRDIVDCDALLVRINPVTRRVIDAAPKLKMIARHGVGINNIDAAYAAQKGIWVTNGPDSNTNSVA